MDVLNTFREHLKLYLVSDRRWNKDGYLEDIKMALDHGVTCLQIREKNLSDEDFIQLVTDIQKFTEVPLIVNDNIHVAKACNAEGVHIGQKDISTLQARSILGKDKILGVSVSTVDQAIQAEKDGADYLGVGAMFTTQTKMDAKPVELKTLKAITEAVAIPVVAIGGITKDNISQLHRTGIYGVAVISSILAEKDIKKATEVLVEKTNQLVHHSIRKVLTIAGSDCSGGAGIQADLKTIAVHKCYGMSVITALTAQNTQGVYAIENLSLKFIENQMDAVFSDIRPEAIKIGMVASKDIITTLSESLKKHKASHIVVDPVMVSTSGSKLLEDHAIQALKEELMPLAEVITPNIYEAQLLADMIIQTTDDMVEAAKRISSWYPGHILIKGGHLSHVASDLLYSKQEATWFSGQRIDNPNTHGTGCTLSSAIASNLAMGYNIKTSIKNSKDYITGAIKDGLDFGKGRGPLNHQYLNH